MIAIVTPTRREPPAPNRAARRRAARMARRRQRRRHRLARAGAVSVTGLLGSFVLVPAEPARAAGFVVANLDDSGPGSLRQAIADANASPGPDTITVKPGLAGSIVLTSGQLVVGDALVIDGGDAGIGGLTVDGGGTTRIIDSTAELTIRDLTITEGSADRGGAIRLTDADLHLERSVISSSTAFFGGGGAVDADGDVTVLDSELKDNFGLNRGGAVDATGSVVATGTTFDANTSASDGGAIAALGPIEITGGGLFGNDASGDGGAVASINSSVTLVDSTITGNTAGDDGGGVFADSGVLATDSTLSDNVAGDRGGAVDAYAATFTGGTISGNTALRSGVVNLSSPYPSLTLSSVTVSDNQAQNGPGGVAALNTYGSVVVTNATVSGNSATTFGGAFVVGLNGSVRIENSTVDGNRAGSSGGAIWAQYASVRIEDSTVSANTTDTSDGGAVLLGASSLTATGSTFSGNHAATVGGVAGGGAVAALDSDVQDSRLTLTATDFVGNSAAEGGAISMNDGELTATEGSDFRSNAATDGDGGAIIARSVEASITGAVFDDNSATGNGGAFAGNGGSLDLAASTVERSSAGSSGGAIWASSPVTIGSSTIDANTAGTNGGGIWVADGPIDLTDTALTGNTAAGFGGGLVATDVDVTVSGTSAVNGNQAGTDGGGISLLAGSLTVTGPIDVVGNTAGRGGGISVDETATTIADADISGNAATDGDGGGIRARQSMVTLTGLTVSGNTATGRGGGIAGETGMTVADSTITDNQAGGDGGGIGWLFEDEGTYDLELDGVTISGNDAGGSGGGVFGPGTTTVAGSTVSGNTAGGDGGGLVGPGTTTVLGSTLSGNTAGAVGGGMSGHDVTIDASTFDANTAGGGGAIAGDDVDVTDSTFSGNTATTSSGGAIDTNLLTATNSTFSGNTAEIGGGAVATLNLGDLGHLTVTDNAAGSFGGGILDGGEGPTGSMADSIVAGNQAPENPDLQIEIAPEWSVVGVLGTTPDTDDLGRPATGLLVGVDPLLGPLAEHGGPTATHLPAPRSPAIDHRPGTESAIPADQRGATRPVGNGVDAGAVEYDGPTPVWIPVTPARLVDTRSTGETIDGRFRGAGTLEAGATLEVDVAGRAGLPPNATAAILNVTAINPTDIGFITVHPCSDTLPIAASVNYTPGVNMPNEVVAGLTDSGTVCIYSSARTHVAVDVVGFVGAPSPLVPVEPARLLDTRPLASTIDGQFRLERRLAAGEEITLDVAGRAGVPADAAAVVVNVIAVRPDAVGFLTTHACEDDRPLASSLNYVAGVNRGNEIVAGLDAEGRLCVYTFAGTDLVVDVMGYLPAGADLTAVEPARVFESRPGTPTVDGEFEGAGRLAAGSETRVRIAGRAGVPADATTVSLNITAVNAAESGFLTVHPCGERPLAASLNYIPGVNGGNDLAAGLSPEGDLCVYNSTETDLTIDVTAFTTL